MLNCSFSISHVWGTIQVFIGGLSSLVAVPSARVNGTLGRRRGLTSLEDLPWQARFALLVGLPAVLPHHIVDPLAVGLQFLTAGKLGGQVHPGRRVTPSADLVRNARLCELAHVLVEEGIGPELVEMLGDGRRVSNVDKVAVLTVLDLEGNATSTGGDNRFALVNGLGNFDFETFTRRELKDNLGAGHQAVEDCRVISIQKSESWPICSLWSLGGIRMMTMSDAYGAYSSVSSKAKTSE